MKPIKFIRLLLLSSFLIVGCDNPFKKKDAEPDSSEKEDKGQEGGGEVAPEVPEGGEQGGEEGGEQGGEEGGEQGGEETTGKEITVKMEALLKGSDTPYEVKFNFDDEYFSRDAEVYDKDLSLLSFGAAISATYKDWVLDFFSDTEFIDPLTHDLDDEPTADTLGYCLAHKPLKDSELFAVAIRGHEYKKEWSNNFIIGETGDHNGFLERSSELYEALLTYVNAHKGDKKAKLWIYGYSRAGAIANTVSSLILRGDDFDVDTKGMFVYTFEAPASLTKEHAIAYKNIHNIRNSADIVTYIPPTQYELYKPGEDFEIYDGEIATLIKEFDADIEIPEFVKVGTDVFDEEVNNDIELTEHLVDSVFSDKEDDTISAHTRALYVANYQSGLSYALGMFFALSGATRSQMMADLQANPMNMFVIMGDETGAAFANFIKTYLEKDEISYDMDELTSACCTLLHAMVNLFNKMLVILLSETYKVDLTRILDMHYPEVTYVLLQNAHSKLAE